ncbi:ankyrin repeat-containing domain protein [Nemania sp. FL0916]|nr:ankyrin repeat-containing domain protein [Nemania sp. FL0916]
MADPFSILAAAAGLTDVSVRASSKLGIIISEFKNAPALILALSNENQEIKIVLERIRESKQAVESLGDTQHDEAFLASLDSQLNDARAILTDLESLAALLSPGRPASKGFRWLRQKKRATKLKAMLKEVREKINESLVVYNPSLQSRIRLELRDIRVGTQQTQASIQAAAQNANNNFQATSGELVSIRTAMAHQQTALDSRLSTIQDTMHTSSQVVNQIQVEQTRQFEATQTVQVAILTELAVLTNVSAATRPAGPMIQPASSHNSFNSVVSFSMRLPGSHCVDGCRCRCHLPARPSMSFKIPPMLRAVFGYLFLSYTGYPSPSARCSVDSCATGKYLRLQVTYVFPFSRCLKYVMHGLVEASMSGTFTFTLMTRRRVRFEEGNVTYEAQRGSAKSVGHMLRHDRGCLRDIANTDGRSVLHLALGTCNPESIEIMKLLLQHGADPDQEDDFGISPRLFASWIIVSKTSSAAYTRALEDLFPLSSCVEALELSYVHKIVLGLLPISLETALRNPVGDLLNAKDRSGRTPLMWAVKRVNVAAVRALLSAGAGVNEVDLSGYTALHWAVPSKSKESLACVDALLHAGANINAMARDGYSIMHCVAEYNQVVIGRRLIAAGADVNPANPISGSTPMHRAAYYNSVDMIRCLYDAGANLESENNGKVTPLFYAIERGAKEALALLLSLGANAAHVTNAMRTPLHHVALYTKLETMRSLTDAGVRDQDATARDRRGFTAQQWLDKRQPRPEMRAAFTHLSQVWCSAVEVVDDEVSDEEDCFYDALEDIRG